MSDVAELLKRLREVVSTPPDSNGLATNWYRNPDGPEAADLIEALTAENEQLRDKLAKANEAHWFYFGDDCSSNQCRFSIDECIDEDFEWGNRAQGDHVFLVSGARPVPDVWVALHYYTNAEKDARGDDEQYTFTVHDSEEEARQALKDTVHD